MKALSDYNGEYLCSLNTKLTRVSETIMREEPDMFCKISIMNGVISFPGNCSVQLMDFITSSFKNKKPLIENIEKYIQNNKKLLKICKKSRIGYTPHSSKTGNYTKINQALLEKRFVTKVLTQKGDLENLKEYLKENE